MGDHRRVRDVAEDYVEAVLDLVAQIPPGRASTYGVIAEAARERTGKGSARTVGRVMALYGSDVPWWRVVTASGAAAERVAGRALEALRAEGVPLTAHNPPRVDLREAGWEPGEEAEPAQM
ncbi:MGMT family protein [Ruania sp. N2-46]|uniref:MGMT family protein n=1 Tax=Occultella gossypii TaxID=2800820 RepID=A0ABS7S784_9MICO|nr:MGMT family protein [Occultella gossypii]